MPSNEERPVETSLYYITSRYYDPEIGRFISPDSVDYLDPTTINGLNLYAYCGNDPVNNVDPTGHFVITLSSIFITAVIGLFAGAIIGGAAGGISATANGDNIGLGILAGAIGGGIMGAGAGVASLFLAPVIAGEGILIASATGTGFAMGTAMSAGAAVGIGLGVSVGTGIIGGGLTDMLNQVINDGGVSDWSSIGISALEGGVLNMLSGVLGGFGGTTLSNPMNFLVSLQLNVIPSGYGLVIDILRNYIKNKKGISYAG